MPVRFSGCVFDADARELRRDGQAVPLSPRAFALLKLLLESRPRPLSHRQLRDALWPGTTVGYTSLAQAVAEVRRAIGDAGGPSRLIRTVPRFGYAFVAALSDDRPAMRTAGTFVGEEREYLISEGETLVGRGEECGLRLPSARVSRVHARLRADAGRVSIEDAGSKNGTWVNGLKRVGSTVLDEGDEVAFGTFRVTFRRAGSTGSTRTGRPA